MVGQNHLDVVQIAPHRWSQSVIEVDEAPYSVLVCEGGLIVGEQALRVELDLHLYLSCRYGHLGAGELPTDGELPGSRGPIAVI